MHDHNGYARLWQDALSESTGLTGNPLVLPTAQQWSEQARQEAQFRLKFFWEKED